MPSSRGWRTPARLVRFTVRIHGQRAVGWKSTRVVERPKHRRAAQGQSSLRRAFAVPTPPESSIGMPRVFIYLWPPLPPGTASTSFFFSSSLFFVSSGVLVQVHHPLSLLSLGLVVPILCLQKRRQPISTPLTPLFASCYFAPSCCVCSGFSFVQSCYPPNQSINPIFCARNRGLQE